MIIDLTEDDEGHQGQPKAPTVVAPRVPLPSSAPIVQDQGLPLPIPVSHQSPHQIILQNYMSNRYPAQTQLPSSTFPLMPANLPYNATYRNLPHPANPLAQNQMIYHPPQTQPMPPPSTVKRVLPATVTSTPAPVSAYQANMATRAAATNNTTTKIAVESLNVKFSVVDHQYFTARAETGHVTSSILDCLKRTPGAKFDKASSRWLFPFGSHQVLFHALQKNRCQVEMIPHGIIAAAQLKINKNSSDDQLFVSQVLEPLVGPKVLGHLAPFQQEAVKFIHDKKGRALIADEMGLGKTRTAIGGALLYQEHWPTLIVCPSSARFHWQAELLAILSPEIIDAREVTVVENGQHAIVSNSSQYAYKFVIISYSLVAKLQERLQKSNFGVVIADESHYLKTRKALRTKALLPLIHAAKCALLLSGTPALSRPVELFTQLHALQPTQWNDFKAFGKRYCVDPRPNKEKSMYNSHNRFNFGENAFKGANNTQELHVILTSTIMIRRLKKDILTQLPQKKRYLVKVGVEDDAERRRLRGMLSQLSQYEELLKKRKVTRTKHRRAYADDGDDDNDDDVGEEAQVDPLDDAKKKRKSLLMELFRDSGIAKLPSILKQLQRFLDVDGSGKVLVFAHHRNVLDGVCRFLRDHDVDFIRIDGMTQSSDRHQRTQQFQTDAKIRVGVLGITAAGIALTLTAAHVVFFAEMFWTPGSLIQAEDRAHRIGQTRDVKIFYFFAESTIDELLWPLVRKKLQLLGEIVEGKSGLDLAAQAKDEVTTKARAVAAAAAAASRTDSSQELGNNDAPAEGEGAVMAASSSSSNLTVGMKRKSTTENVYKDEEGRLVFDLLEDDDDFEELMHEMVRESTAEFHAAAATTATDHSSDDDADADAAEAQPDDYEEYLKRSVPPDKLASSYLKELAEKEKRTLEHWQQKYAAQEEAVRENPTLGSFLSASQSMERTVFQDTSPSKMNHDFSAIMDEAADNEPVKSEVTAAVQGVSSSNHSSRPVVIDLLDSSDDDDDDDDDEEPVQSSIAGYQDRERVEVDIPSSAPLPPPPPPPPPPLLPSSDAPVGFNKLRDAVAKRASSQTASPPSSSASVPSMPNAVREGDYPCPETYTLNDPSQGTTSFLSDHDPCT